MKKIVSRFVPVFVVIAMLTFSALPALAQDGADPLCNGLSDADCQLMLAGQASMEGVTSFAAPSYSIGFMLNDGTDDMAFSAAGSGEFMLPVDGDMTSLMIHLFIDEASISDSGSSESGSAEVIVVDSMAYIKYEGEWYGDTLTEEDLGDFSDLGTIIDPNMLSGGGMGDMGVDMTGVVSTARGADQDMMGQSMAVFTTTVDINQLIVVLLSSPMVGGLLGEAMGGDAGMEMSPEDLQMLGAFLTPMIAGTSLTFEQWVGVDDQMMHKIAVDAVLNLDMSMFDPESTPITGELHFASEITSVNESFSVTPPESYRSADELDLDLEELGATLDM